MQNVIAFPASRLNFTQTPIQPLLSISSTVVVLSESRSFKLSRLKTEMFEPDSTRSMLRSVRPYTQKFCKIARENSGIAVEDLCERMNTHPSIIKLGSLPGAYRFIPITADFLHDLENNISKIIEYNPYGGGFWGLGAFGAPTLKIAEVIAELCGASRDFRRFKKWCREYPQHKT